MYLSNRRSFTTSLCNTGRNARLIVSATMGVPLASINVLRHLPGHSGADHITYNKLASNCITDGNTAVHPTVLRSPELVRDSLGSFSHLAGVSAIFMTAPNHELR